MENLLNYEEEIFRTAINNLKKIYPNKDDPYIGKYMKEIIKNLPSMIEGMKSHSNACLILDKIKLYLVSEIQLTRETKYQQWDKIVQMLNKRLEKYCEDNILFYTELEKVYSSSIDINFNLNFKIEFKY